ncbi:MAG: hypothetical protein HOH36_01265 [Acidimicrobiaceae bacterium]|nr:hypothetical protein [Acidimicrobiaceae bacterium]MBT5580545.1 hypothetical protein [Acidimicrobiaceae bacterium]MBT5849042.1 hypothetical protein [Acidimicrobiaceae bacterium]
MAKTFGDKIEIEWRSFLLRTEPKASDQAKFVKYTESWLRPAATEPDAKFQVWATDNLGPTSSIPAQVAAKVMDGFAPESADAFHWRLLEAYFSENRTISDWSVLGDLAAEIGVDRSGFLAMVNEQQQVAAQMVIDEHNSAIENGVTAVPTIVLDNALPIPGAQELESYEIWINKLLAKRDQ